jgi:hypothetical protein
MRRLTDEELLMSEHSHKEIDWIHRLILPCAEVARTLSDANAAPLPWRQRFALRVHLVLCRFCARYQRQLERLRLALSHSPVTTEAELHHHLSPEARDRIRQALRR